MGLESASFISSLNEAWPLGSDQRLTADDHLRNIKASLKNTFPNITGAMRATQDELNALTGVTVNVQAKLDSFSNSFSQVHARIDSDSAVLTALRNEFSQSFSQIHAQATSLAAIDTALGARIDSDSAILTALRNEFSQSFSQLHAQAVSLAAIDTALSAQLTSQGAVDTALSARIDSDSAIMTALRNEFSQSFSQVHVQVDALSATFTATRNSFSQSFSQIQASLTSQGAVDTALGARIDSDSAIMTALRNEFSQSFSQVHVQVDALSATFTTTRNAFSQSFSQIQASLTSQGAADTALGARIDSDSAIMTALRNEFSQSFSQTSARITALENSLSQLATTYSGFVAARPFHLYGESASTLQTARHSAYFYYTNGATNVTLGPPGVAGVTTWTALDAIPSLARAVLLQIDGWAIGDTGFDVDAGLELYGVLGSDGWYSWRQYIPPNTPAFKMGNQTLAWAALNDRKFTVKGYVPYSNTGEWFLHLVGFIK